MTTKFQNARVLGYGLTRASYPNHVLPRGDARRAVSQSDLKTIMSNPHKWLKGADDEGSDAMEFGSLVDCLLLTPEAYSKTYAMTPAMYIDQKTGVEKPWNFNANICKEWRDTLPAGVNIVSPSDVAEARKTVDNLYADNAIAGLLKGAKHQCLICAEYTAENGVTVPVAALIDIVPAKVSKRLADLKTARDASPDGWNRVVFKLGYHIQGAFYLDIFNAVPEHADDQRDGYRHIIVENEAPYEVGRRELDGEFIAIGRDQYQHALEAYATCLQSGVWPGADAPGEWTKTEAEPWMLLKSGKGMMRDQFAELQQGEP